MTTPPIPPGWDFSHPWYHGTPLRLDVLQAGSTITQNEHLARVFSHKPAIVSIDEEEDGVNGELRVRHTGQQPGLLYLIDEPVNPEDVYPHPRTSMTVGLEWLTRRPLRLHLLGPVEIVQEEVLTEEDVAELRRRMGGE